MPICVVQMQDQAFGGCYLEHSLEQVAGGLRGRFADGVAQVDLVDPHVHQILNDLADSVWIYRSFEGTLDHAGDVATGEQAVVVGLGDDRLEAVQGFTDGGVGVPVAKGLTGGGEDGDFVNRSGKAQVH